MKSAKYKIGTRCVTLNYNNDKVSYGDGSILSNVNTDPTYDCEWYHKGYSIQKLFSEREFSEIHSGITLSVKKIVENIQKREIHNFSLIDYHKFVTTDPEHHKVVNKTRDLFASDFNFPILDCIKKLSTFFDFELTDIDQKGKRQHIIVRINRPKSDDYNPPHKDIYGPYDRDPSNYITFINFWIPICGVTSNSSLPIVAESHLLAENKILRTDEGAELEKNKYRVNIILNWDGSNQLKRVKIKQKEVLIFSPHLIHGLALNDEVNQTRVGLEFRLFKK